MEMALYKITKIGLKYCGGCKSEYDRIQTAASIAQRLAGKIEFVPHDDRQAQATLIVAGCATACVDTKPFAGRPIWTITSPRDAERFIELMQNQNDAGSDEADALLRQDCAP